MDDEEVDAILFQDAVPVTPELKESAVEFARKRGRGFSVDVLAVELRVARVTAQGILDDETLFDETAGGWVLI